MVDCFWAYVGHGGHLWYMVTWYLMVRCPISSLSGAISQMVYNSLYTLYIQNPNDLCYDSPLGICPKLHQIPFPLLIPFNLPNSMAHLSGLLLLQSESASDLSFSLGPIQNRKISKSLDKWVRAVFTSMNNTTHKIPRGLSSIIYSSVEGDTRYNELSFTLEMMP